VSRVQQVAMDPERQLQDEFNRWADAGRGEEMEDHHRVITEPVLPLMELQPGQGVLDLGCGAGWATRLLAQRVAPGRAVGVDVSDEMIRRARLASAGLANVEFLVGPASKIPVADGTCDRVLSVESFYYYPDQEGALEEIRRVMARGGRLFILINLYRDNPYSLEWVNELNVPVHVRSEADYVSLLEAHGFAHVEARRVPDTSPTPDVYTGRWFRNAEELRAFKWIGALLLMGTKQAA